MPRTALGAAAMAASKGPGPGTISAGDLTKAPQAADVGNMNYAKLIPGDILNFINTGASPYTVTLTSAPDDLKRTGDIAAYSLAAGEVADFHYGDLNGWLQSDGTVYFQGSNAAVKFWVTRRP